MLSDSITMFPAQAWQLYDHNNPLINLCAQNELINPMKVSIHLKLPSIAMEIKIEKVYLIGNEILTQARVLNAGQLGPAIGKTAIHSVYVNLPWGVNPAQLKTYHFVLGKKEMCWFWSIPESNVTYIDGEDTFEKMIMFKLDAFQRRAAESHMISQYFSNKYITY